MGWGSVRPRPGTQHAPLSRRLPPLLTVILLGRRVLDERRELVKDVAARHGGLLVAGRQAGESAGGEGRGPDQTRVAGRRALPGLCPGASSLGAPPAVPQPRALTRGAPVSPPETPLSAACLSSRRRHRAGWAAASQGRSPSAHPGTCGHEGGEVAGLRGQRLRGVPRGRGLTCACPLW